MKESFQVYQAFKLLPSVANKNNRNLQMPGDGRYQPEDLKPYLGYDMWAAWLILVEWFWMKTLAKLGIMPKKDAKLLTMRLLMKLLTSITTTYQDIVEKRGGGHDILALIAIMKELMPKPLHRWLHLCATSYDIINTAYALQLRVLFENVFMSKLRELDSLWRDIISENLDVVQAGRTHLQTALPVTIGFWLSNLHNRFVKSARIAERLSSEIPGKFSGAVGTSASQLAVMRNLMGEEMLMDMLGLPIAEVSTQITPPEGAARFYHELVLLSGALANLGEDARILQSSQFGEIISASSTSSAMSHKLANPIAAENLAGMHTSVIAEYMKVLMTLVSNLQRDLRGSNVMRSYSAVAVYTYQQLLTAIRLLKSMRVNRQRCQENFEREGRLVVAELLHLSLQKEGLPDAHEFVNKKIVPEAMKSGRDLWSVMRDFSMFGLQDNLDAARIWGMITDQTDPRFRDTTRPALAKYLLNPEKYLGNAIMIARREAENKL